MGRLESEEDLERERERRERERETERVGAMEGRREGEYRKDRKFQ